MGAITAYPSEARFWAKVELTLDGCWLWTGSKTGPGPYTTGGYGTVYWRGEYLLAHRVMWELANGPIPEGMHVLHRCDVRNCVRPDHLFLGTHQDNMADMARKGRAVSGATIRAARKLNKAV